MKKHWPRGEQQDVAGDVRGTVSATLSLTLGAPATFGAFTPGVEKVYTATSSATLTFTLSTTNPEL